MGSGLGVSGPVVQVTGVHDEQGEPNAAKYTVLATSSMCTRFRPIALMRTINGGDGSRGDGSVEGGHSRRQEKDKPGSEAPDEISHVRSP